MLSAIGRLLDLPANLRESERLRRVLETNIGTYREMALKASADLKSLRAQVCTLRVAQAERPRVGWEVMAYISQEVADRMQDDPAVMDWVQETIVRGLVAHAVKGIVHVNSQGKVNALVFQPLDVNNPASKPQWVQALYERPEGGFKFSEKAKITYPESEEQRVRKACGL